MKKKILVLGLATLMTFSLVACGKDDEEEVSTEVVESTEESTEETVINPLLTPETEVESSETTETVESSESEEVSYTNPDLVEAWENTYEKTLNESYECTYTVATESESDSITYSINPQENMYIIPLSGVYFVTIGNGEDSATLYVSDGSECYYINDTDNTYAGLFSSTDIAGIFAYDLDIESTYSNINTVTFEGVECTEYIDSFGYIYYIYNTEDSWLVKGYTAVMEAEDGSNYTITYSYNFTDVPVPSYINSAKNVEEYAEGYASMLEKAASKVE